MCGLLSTRRFRKSFSEPRISDDTARKKATPRTTPVSDTRVWRLRLVRWASATSSAMAIASALRRCPGRRRGRHSVGALPAAQRLGGRQHHHLAFGEPGDDFRALAARHAFAHLALVDPAVLHHPDRAALERPAGDEQGVLAARDDQVGVHRLSLIHISEPTRLLINS